MSMIVDTLFKHFATLHPNFRYTDKNLNGLAELRYHGRGKLLEEDYKRRPGYIWCYDSALASRLSSLSAPAERTWDMPGSVYLLISHPNAIELITEALVELSTTYPQNL